ncbi:MAG: class I SAM-dependent methyltransferase [Pirellulales bacterium]|jgi:SAM-dependent methyltransferase|nr:class I SAM-dependent methyltransferase [Thermoguttaceae bacterium]MDD4789772.1 class I SAM-dependent methyltransferase [Pirellulales bacterium]MDI9444993.1 class I SAM-dependent methyltransferase [Planctomycetota bacterium]NLZ00095.1 class I SAM-dependent methyltransferase [Pirellulaceae bacterium]
MASNVELACSAEVERFLAEETAAFTRELAMIAAEVDDHPTPFSQAHLERLTAAAENSRQACHDLELRIGEDQAALRAAQAAYRAAIAPWFDRSWLMHRAKFKPKGYPGDYAILTAIYDRLPKSPGIGGYLDLYFLNTQLGRAVPARLRAVREFLIRELGQRGGEVSVLNVACGPCREYTEDFEIPPAVRPRITCLDSDEEALEFARQNLARRNGATPDVSCARYNALRMSSAKRNIEAFGRPDVIYSIGLFDYITDRHLVPILKGLRETLAAGGVLYVAFKDADRYDKTVYQWMVDWFFLQRTERQCLALCEQAGFDTGRIDVCRDETGIILNFISRSAPAARYRIDAAQGAAEPRAVPAASPSQPPGS